jgi:hypothetical protein
MPHFVKGLADVQECCCTVFVILQGYIYDVGYTVDLFNSNVFLSETELVVRYNPFFCFYYKNWFYYMNVFYNVRLLIKII